MYGGDSRADHSQVGAGQTGLQIAARFKAMDIPTLVIETNERVGDNWRKRYDSLALHTTPEQHQCKSNLTKTSVVLMR